MFCFGFCSLQVLLWSQGVQPVPLVYAASWRASTSVPCTTFHCWVPCLCSGSGTAGAAVVSRGAASAAGVCCQLAGQYSLPLCTTVRCRIAMFCSGFCFLQVRLWSQGADPVPLVYAASWWASATVDRYLSDRALPIWVSLAKGHLELFREIQTVSDCCNCVIRVSRLVEHCQSGSAWPRDTWSGSGRFKRWAAVTNVLLGYHVW
jgi:hypothetical protein